ncbi:peroxiredoxin-like family protein [Myxococcus sp. RHSTA-1-4]|uniref:peroxiredoxin-like family protein n=1 Tax=Myxococcus sp. RHSTA-1-4 TaxID=2874601 RepID=UPI001CBD11D2|nr:peroxiredoxin-like family protein [Myxococcus sp. RHSTA-1-4]MBZ4423150.1 AhpC/TSA family protein [Myxococcus sp. RHSTA-1-4]
MTSSSSRRVAGEILSPFSLETLSHGRLQVPGPGLVHLQFRRFAGCPICSLHLRSFARGLSRLEAAGITSVAFFHSSAESLRPYHADLPLPVVPDPERIWYRAFGVERSLRSILDPRSWGAGVRGMVGAPSNPLAGEGGHLGLPADFLVAPDGRILDVHYGAHADDHWELEELLERAERAPLRSSA